MHELKTDYRTAESFGLVKTSNVIEFNLWPITTLAIDYGTKFHIQPLPEDPEMVTPPYPWAAHSVKKLSEIPDYSSPKGILPDAEPEAPQVHLETLSPHPVTVSWEKRLTIPGSSLLWGSGGEGWGLPESLFLQARHTQLPQLRLIRLVLPPASLPQSLLCNLSTRTVLVTGKQHTSAYSSTGITVHVCKAASEWYRIVYYKKTKCFKTPF